MKRGGKVQVVGKDSDASTSLHKTPNNILLGSTVNQGNLEGPARVVDFDLFAGNVVDPVGGIAGEFWDWLGHGGFANGNMPAFGAKVAQEGYYGSSIDSGKSWDTRSSTPFAEGFNCVPVGILGGIIVDYRVIIERWG